MSKKNEIVIIVIIIFTLVLYNILDKYIICNNNIIENADFETYSMSSSLSKILLNNTLGDVTTGKLTSNEITSTKITSTSLCINNTCLSENQLKILNQLSQDHIETLNGKKSLYIYKPNDHNKYIFDRDNDLSMGNSTDNDSQKIQRGTWRISNSIPQNQNTCGGFSTSSQCI